MRAIFPRSNPSLPDHRDVRSIGLLGARAMHCAHDHGLNLRAVLSLSEALVMLDCALGLGALHSHPRLSAVRSHHPLFLIELEQVRMYRAARGAA